MVAKTADFPVLNLSTPLKRGPRKFKISLMFDRVVQSAKALFTCSFFHGVMPVCSPANDKKHGSGAQMSKKL